MRDWVKWPNDKADNGTFGRLHVMIGPQNIYDEEAFFQGYRRLRETGTGLNDVLEQPALLGMLPKRLDGLRVLDLGCGFGIFARRARELGAASVLGIDVSERMLAEARKSTQDRMITYLQLAIEHVVQRTGPFDLVVSSLALHYVADYAVALRDVAGLLRTGGLIAFSVEHPIMTALPEQRWQCDANGDCSHWPVDNYSEEGPRHTHWFVDGVVKYHRTVASYVSGLLAAGFTLTAMSEPTPSEEALASRADLEDHQRRPPFLVLAGQLQR
jgi:2-polyprenyl-3-methyl-5-hydroxy-6-metoxy-1,4-benzoquinol methylase